MRSDAPMKIILIEDNQYEVTAFQNYCHKAADIDLAAATGSKTEGLLAVAQHRPDAVILDLQLEEGNGLDFVYELSDLALKKTPYIIVTTTLSNEATLQNLRDHGVGYIQMKTQPGYMEHGPEMVIGFLRRMRPYFGNEMEQPRAKPRKDVEKELRDKITLELNKICIVQGTHSQKYLVETILVIATLPVPSIDMNNIVYPELEKRLGMDWRAMERAMRYRIEKVWDTVAPDILAANYCQYVDPARGKPTLKEFVAYYANKVKKD